ncbi:AraC family transcriptional regulator ligand-binding domain-containing protein [Burkholderia cepacia]|nr:AraC family transcriptional regulator ligand-binding domain-containing protein [Burkholderia cepacia]
MTRAAALTNFERVARECGLNGHALVREIGLPARCLQDPDLRVPAASLGALLELAAARSGEHAFGLRMAAARRLSNLGPLGLLLRDQSTLRDALQVLVAYVHTHAEALSVSLLADGPIVIIREESMIEGGLPFPQAMEMAMGTTFRLLRLFLGESWLPRMVTFRHAAPVNLSFHRSLFGSHVAFHQEFNDIVCSADDLDVPNPGADPVMAHYSQRLLEQQAGSHTTMSERVRRLIILLLPRGNCRAEVIAQQLGVTRRTITNRLFAEGATFKGLVDEIRRDLLATYLKEGSRNLSEVATLLGFSELSAFSRWHRHQFQVTASSRKE